MSLLVTHFPPTVEAQFCASRNAALAEINVTTFWLVAVLVMIFSWWDWYVDPVHWKTALMIRSIGAAVILASGLVQRLSGRVDWAPTIAKVRFAAAVTAVAGALAVLDQGYVLGVAGLVSVLLSGPYIAQHRRDLLVLYAIPMVIVGVIMFAAGLNKFAVINSSIFLALSIAVSLLLARVFEASNRRAFALEQELMREARTDALTGLHNRRALEESAGVELKRSARTSSPLSVILCDVDHFKQINDRHGHDAGDQVIRAVAEQLRTVVRATDALGRWGGEEFLAILPDTGEYDAAMLAERMRVVVVAAIMPIAKDVRVTISLGVAGAIATTGSDEGQWSRIVKAADDAMYRAKEAGRNRVVAAGPARE